MLIINLKISNLKLSDEIHYKWILDIKLTKVIML